MRTWLFRMDDNNDHDDNDEYGVGNFFENLPEGFVANALALTSPRDVCRLSLVCSVFRSAAEWDAVWEKFLPLDYHKILMEAGRGLARFGTKKELYISLCDHPLIIDGGNKSFSLDKRSGKKCYMLAARDLSIVWGDTPRYWRWVSVPDSRFAEVAELMSVCWFEVYGKINTTMLSKDTHYVAYLVYKVSSDVYGFEQPAEVSIGFSDVQRKTMPVFLDPEASQSQRYSHGQAGRRLGIISRIRGRLGSHSNDSPPMNGPKQRPDGWLEIELGEFYNEKDREGELDMRVMEVRGGNWKGGLIVQGFEIRPKAN